MARLGPLVLLFGLLSRCGGGGLSSATVHITPLPAHRMPARHVTLRPGEHRTFGPGVLRPGDVVTCFVSGGTVRLRVPNRPNGNWSVGKRVATAGGQGGELQLRSTPDGSATATCRR